MTRQFGGAGSVGAALVMGLCWSTPVFAQAAQPPAAEQPAPEAEGLVDIVVTAQRRESALQDTPVAVSAIGEDALQANGSRFLEDISVQVPGLQLPGRTIYNQFPTSIRGISSIDTGVAFDMPVAVYIDGVYVGRQFAVRSALAGVERIEVLRGPQGVTFGRNAAAGAIQIIHRAPSSTPGGMVRASYGSFETYVLDASVEGPLADKVNGVLNMGYQRSRGSIYNRTLDKYVAGNRTFNASAAIDFRPTDDLLLRLRGDYEEGFSNYGGRRLTKGFGGPLVSAIDRRTLEREQGFPLGEVRNDFDSFLNRETGGTSLEVNYDAGGVNLISLTAVRYSKMSGQVDTDATDTLFARNISHGKHNQFSQEFRASSSGEGPLNWDVGLYYFQENVNNVANITVVPTNTLVFVPGTNKLKSYAAFANATYEVATGLELEAGVRYTYETKDFTQGATALDDSWKAWTPRFGANYHINEDVMVYATVSKGFKSGGFNILPPESFGTERVWAYELGLKSEFLDRRLRLNVAAFHEDYDGLQVTVSTGPGTTKTSNADARLRGVEVEAAALLAPGLTLSGNVAFLDATYRRYVFSTTPLIQYAGNRLPRASRWKGAAAIEYSTKVGGGTGSARLAYSYEGAMPQNDANTPALIRPQVGLLDARIAFKTGDERFELAAYGRNLTDKQYIGVVQFLFAHPVGFANENRRSFGLEGTFRF